MRMADSASASSVSNPAAAVVLRVWLQLDRPAISRFGLGVDFVFEALNKFASERRALLV